MNEDIVQNPNNVAPLEITDVLCVLEVKYVGYDECVHAGKMIVHKDVADDVCEFFAHALEMKFPIEKVIPISDQQYAWDDERSCSDNNSSGFNYRCIAGTTRLSNHATGHAFDINPRENPYIRYDIQGNEIFRVPKNGTYDTHKEGTLTEKHPLVIFMRERGWTWGGDWNPKEGSIDYQHFEKYMDSPQE